VKNQESANSEEMFRLRCASLNMTEAFKRDVSIRRGGLNMTLLLVPSFRLERSAMEESPDFSEILIE
jgi:hypothetical protein